ncbi:hypothetical protein CYY_010197 [Polysphondylium violaceum]|uniref:SET domain-containing protein n=1 Tax=Polysphondylium violaceum TaxID=133409 RepID=A0A8J4UZY4_9MYCE|nr:hypothetical protein CYY_010197 [Polysphondylium violaceum]
MKRENSNNSQSEEVSLLVKEFEKEGLKLNSKRVSLSTHNSLSNTPLVTSPIPERPLQQQIQQQLYQHNNNNIHSKISLDESFDNNKSIDTEDYYDDADEEDDDDGFDYQRRSLMSSSGIAPQSSPFLVGYALEDMNKDDELALIPTYLIPLHPCADYQSLSLLLHYFKHSSFCPDHLKAQHHHIKDETHLSEIISFKLKLSESFTQCIYSFLKENPNFLSNLSISLDQFIWIIYFVIEYYHNTIDQNSNNPSSAIFKRSKTASIDPNSLLNNNNNNNNNNSNSNNRSTLNVSSLSYYEIFSGFVSIQTPFTSNKEDDAKTILETNSSKGSSSSDQLDNSNYQDISVLYLQYSNYLESFFKWILLLLDCKSMDNQKIKTCLFKSYNFVKVASIVDTKLAHISFKGFLPLPHYLMRSNLFMPSKSKSYSVNFKDKNIFIGSLENESKQSINELVAVLKNRLFKGSPIYLDNIEIITMHEYQVRVKRVLSSNQTKSITKNIRTSLLNEEFDEDYDLYNNEELLLFYGYALEDFDFLPYQIQVYRPADQLEKVFGADQDELKREINLMKIKMSIIKKYLGSVEQQRPSIKSSNSFFKSNVDNEDIGKGKVNKNGYYLDGLTREKKFGINLLELARISKLREGESYFYEEGQCSTMINYRNEMETLVYLSKEFKVVQDKINDKLKLISLSLNILGGGNNSGFITELERYYKSHQSIIEQSLLELSTLKNNFTKPTVKSVPFVKPTDEVYRRFENWLKNNGVVFPKLQIANFTDSTGRGVVTTKKVDENETVISVPKNLLINVDVARAHPVLGPIFADLHFNDDTILFLFVIYEKENQNSFWRPFYDTLPSYFTTSLHYTATELMELEGTNLFDETLQTKQQLQSFRDYLFPELSIQFPDIFPESTFSWENFLWARSLLDSRAIQLKIDGVIKSNLVPMADMINHHTHAQISSRLFDQESNCFKMVSSCSIPANNQIYLHYGALQNWELALYYGFIIPNNVYDSLHIGFDLNNQEEEQEGQLKEGDEQDKQQTPISKEEMSLLQMEKLQLLSNNHLSPDSHFLCKDHIPSKIFATLRVILLPPKEFNPFIDIWNPINRLNEESVFQTLYSLVLMLLKQFSTTYQEDQQLLDPLLERIYGGNSLTKSTSTQSLKNNDEVDDQDSKKEDDQDDDDEEEDNDIQNSEQMIMVLQYRIEQKQILTCTIERILEIMKEMDFQIPESPSDFSDYDEEEDDDDEYYSDTNDDDDNNSQ